MKLQDIENIGNNLRERIAEEKVTVDRVVFISIDSFPIAKEIALDKGLPLNMILTRPIKDPKLHIKEIGAVADDGTLWLDDEAINNNYIKERLIEQKRKEKMDKINSEIDKYGVSTDFSLKSESILIITDGILDDNRLKASIGRALKSGAKNITVATPVISNSKEKELISLGCKVITVIKPQFASSKDHFHPEEDLYRDEISRHVD